MTAEGERKNTKASMKRLLGCQCITGNAAKHPKNLGVERRGGMCGLTHKPFRVLKIPGS